jgi:predicted dehydrogenase
MLEGTRLDGAIVCVPHAMHAPVGRTLLGRGLHVLMEKPMALDPADARALDGLSRARGVELIIGYPWQYNTHVRTLRDAVQDGRIGDVEATSCLYASNARELYRSSRVVQGPGDAPRSSLPSLERTPTRVSPAAGRAKRRRRTSPRSSSG